METITKRLRRDHDELERIFEEVRNAVEGADAATISEVWTEFERRLERHLDAEERLLLPRLRRHHPSEVRRIEKEHATIRSLVAELGIQADLRTLRKDVADVLVTALERHAAFEERGLYRWADQELSAPHRTGLLEAFWRRGGAVL
jgi:hemerythrin-like domain-containing protein